MNEYRTPLRYPGGKQKLAPFVAELIVASRLQGCEYAEPYAGGAGVGIALLLSGIASKIHLNDSSVPVYAFWRSIVRSPEEFCRRIVKASLNIDEWLRQREVLRYYKRHAQLDVGFSFFFLNRCNRSGIPSGGVIGGLKQTGQWLMDARFPRNELIRRIELIAERASDISMKNLDAEVFLREHVAKLPAKTLVYCDPPYFNKSDRLYLNHYQPHDHARLAGVMQRSVAHPWLVSYDNAPSIRRLYVERRSFTYGLQYNAAVAYKGREVFIFSDKLVLPETSAVPAVSVGLARCRGRARAHAKLKQRSINRHRMKQRRVRLRGKR